MSRSPRTTQDARSIQEYRSAWQATMQLLRAGHSFSGHERNCAFLNCADGQFAHASAVSGLDFDDDGRALGVTDWDGDGDVDVWVANRSGPRLRLLRNQTITRPVAESAFVSFRLQGTHSNRDAIGARIALVIGDESRPLIQTLRAGDGYLSQSSKSIHFGLGSQVAVKEAVVRWPAGQTERFSGIQPGKRYRLIEGSGRATELASRPMLSALVASSQPAPPTGATHRTVLSNRLPSPMLSYRSLDGLRAQTIEPSGGPLLVLLWTSWCAPCISELQAIVEHEQALREAGLDVLALTLDTLDQSAQAQPGDAEQLMEQLRFPFTRGIASREMLDKLELAESIVFNRASGLVVPTSWLLDTDGSISAIYHGRVEVPVLLEDVARLKTPPDQRRDLAIPIPGRWANPPRSLLLRSVARIFRDHGYDTDYARYLKLDTDVIRRQREQAASEQQRRQLDAQYAAANYNLGLELTSSGQSNEAMQYFKRAVEVRPDHLEALINLGAMLAQSRRFDQAIEVLRRSVDVDPDSVAARTNLAAALGSSGDFAGSAENYRHILRTRPETPGVHSRLARVLLEAGDLPEAAAELTSAIQENPRDFPAALSLAWLRATSSHESIRDGAQAVQIAEQLKGATQGKDPRVLDVLAAARAEQGDFDTARKLAEQALRRVGSRNQELRSALQRRLRNYQAETVVRDTDGKY